MGLKGADRESEGRKGERGEICSYLPSILVVNGFLSLKKALKAAPI